MIKKNKNNKKKKIKKLWRKKNYQNCNQIILLIIFGLMNN